MVRAALSCRHCLNGLSHRSHTPSSRAKYGTATDATSSTSQRMAADPRVRGRPGLDALCRVLEAWIAHLLGGAVRIEPVQAIRDERWSWHVGLDGEATAILNELYRGAEVPEERLRRLLALFRLSFIDASQMLPEVAGRPVYLGLAMSADRRLRMKPQNLVTNLPLAKSV